MHNLYVTPPVENQHLVCPSTDMHAAALQWYGQGLNIVPQNMQTKHPSVRWKPYQTERISPFELHRLRARFRRGGIGVICGAISNLIVVDFDGIESATALLSEWEQLSFQPALS